MTSQYISSICDELRRGRIEFIVSQKSISIPLPRNFGILEVCEYEERKDTIQLSDSLWGTHGYLLAREYKMSNSEVAIRCFIEHIYTGQLKMVIASDKYGGPYKAIWSDLEIQSADKENYKYQIC